MGKYKDLRTILDEHILRIRHLSILFAVEIANGEYSADRAFDIKLEKLQANEIAKALGIEPPFVIH